MNAFGKCIFSVSAYIPTFRMPSCKQHDRQIVVETTQMTSSTTIWCFRNSEWLRQDLTPRISHQRDWCIECFPRYFCNSNSNSNSNHFLAASGTHDPEPTTLLCHFSLYNLFTVMEINKNNKIIKVSEGPELSELRLTYCWNIVKYYTLKAKYGLEKVLYLCCHTWPLFSA